MNSSGNWVLQIDLNVLKILKKFPRKDNERILEAIEHLPENPYLGDIQKMRGEQNVWRRRIGSYRIFFEIFPKENVIHVFHVERRTTTTY